MTELQMIQPSRAIGGPPDPPSATHGREKNAAPAGEPGGAYVLVVDDHADYREVVAIQLRMHGFRVLEADSAGAAWELACRHPIGAAVLDVRLPGIDGCALAHQLRTTFGVPTILALTAWTPASPSGFDAVFLKPDVEPVVRTLMSRMTPPPGPAEC